MKNLFNYLSLLFLLILILLVGYMLFQSFSGAFTTHTSWVNSVDINNQNIIASADDGGIILWDKQKAIAKLSNQGDMVKTLAFSHNGKLIVSGSIDNAVKIWSVADKMQVKELGSYKSIKVAFDHADRYVITDGFKENIKIWDWKQGTLIKELPSEPNVMRGGFSISRDNVLAYLDTGCTIKLFNINTLKEIKTLTGYCGIPQINPDGKTIAIKVKSKPIQIIDIATQKVIAELNNDQDSNAFEPFKFNETWLANGVGSNLVQLWDWHNKKLIRTVGIATLSGFGDMVLSNNNQLLTAGGDRSVKVWDLKTGNLKLDIGSGQYQNNLNSWLTVIAIAALFFGFCGILYSVDNIYSSLSVKLILSVWSIGILLILFLIKPPVTKYATALAWIATIIAALCVLSLYGAMLALYSLPFALFFGYQQIMYDREKKGTYVPVFISLILCGFICYLKYFKN